MSPVRTYRDAGVEIDAGNQLAARLGLLARRAVRPEVVAGIGGFAGICRLPSRLAGEEPLLVASTDGVGTKLKLAFATGRHDSVGIDLVAMGVNDVLTVGAEPLFFLDYFATSKLELAQAETVIAGIVEGCRQARCALLGGETAEMPGFYAPGEYDLAGFTVGVVAPGELIDGSQVEAGNLVLGFPSSGLHSNGYSLARSILLDGDPDLHALHPELGRSLADELLTPTTIYVSAIERLRRAAPVHALAHITGGGLIDNPPRVIPEGLAFRLERSRWRVPKVMELIARKGGVGELEMLRTFNMGLGLLAVVPATSAPAALAACTEDRAALVGEIVAREGEPVELLP